MATTLTEENYLKAIYHLSTNTAEMVSTNAIAEKVDAKASSVTDMLKKLADKNLLTYIKYKGVLLTENGKLTAIDVIRKHRLWEVFLLEKLNFSWDEVHDVAEELEHIKSDKLINALDAFLEFPTHDPHGDPIPDKHGNITTRQKIVLSNALLNTAYTCVGVIDSNSKFLKYLNRNQIELGTVITVTQKEPFDDSLYITVNGKNLVISKQVAKNLFVTL